MLADAGYNSYANMAAPGPDRIIALGKVTKLNPPAPPPSPGATPRQAMAIPAPTPDGRAQLYKRRGATVEPAIANLKKILDRFSRRGLQQAAQRAAPGRDRLQPPQDPPRRRLLLTHRSLGRSASE